MNTFIAQKNIPTLFLKLVIISLGLITLALCIFALPSMSRGIVIEFPKTTLVRDIFIITTYISVLPFFVILIKGWKLFQSIDRNTFFSLNTLRTLRHITYAAITMSVLYIGSLPLVYTVAQIDDAPGLIIVGMFIILSPLAIAAFAHMLQKILRSKMEIPT